MHGYRESTVCYVYLNDVVVEDDPPWVLPADKHLEDERNRLENSSSARSRWFTRGWTLQELLAPNNIVSMTNTGHISGISRIF
jgi:hypothetical protein